MKIRWRLHILRPIALIGFARAYAITGPSGWREIVTYIVAIAVLDFAYFGRNTLDDGKRTEP